MNELEEMIKTLKSKLRHEKNVVSQISNELKLLKNKQVWHKVAEKDLEILDIIKEVTYYDKKLDTVQYCGLTQDKVDKIKEWLGEIK